MSAHVVSVNVGQPDAKDYLRGRPSAIDKRPVASIEVRDPGPTRGGLGSGVVGDDVVSRKHHGGTNQAVYAYAREDLDWWGAQIERSLDNGVFGENLTVSGVDCTTALVGETWRVGSALLQVRCPRIPCATFSGHMGVPRWVKRFAAEGRTGAYLAVLEPGTVAAGDEVMVERPGHDVTLLQFFRAAMGDRQAAARVLDSGALDDDSAAELARFRP